jgi:predicted Zn-dependent protease
MKTCHKVLLAVLLSVFSLSASAQNRDAAKALVKEGITLHDAGKYDEAIAKYDEAIKADPGYSNGYYEKGFTLFSTGKGKDALPCLEKVLKLDPQSPGAYDMIGSIYDDDKQTDKAIEYFQKGLKIDSTYQRLYYNMAITYYRLGKYADAEVKAIKAIKLDPKHASSQRVYAMTTYSEDKRGVSLLAWCSFLLLEPQTKRAEVANDYIQKILNYGIKKTGEKSVTLSVSTSDMEGPNFLMPMAILTATSDKKNLTRADSLSLTLTKLFEISDNFASKKGDTFYKTFFSDYFKKLAATDNMPAFSRYITLSTNKEENLQWFKENDTKLSALDGWISTAKREF